MDDDVGDDLRDAVGADVGLTGWRTKGEFLCCR